MGKTPEYSDRVSGDVTGTRSISRITAFFLFLGFIATTLTGCNETFQPLADNDQVYFSIYGALDASADTQKVRVTPVRGSILPDQGPGDVSVMLEHLGSGQKAALRDSLYTFRFDDIFYARNYLTDMDLDPGETYQLVAEHADGRKSSVMVTLPDDFPEPEYNLVCNDSPSILSSIEVFIEGADNLAAVTADYTYVNLNSNDQRQTSLTVQHYSDVRERASGGHYVRVNILQDLIDLLGINGSISHIRVNHISIFVANAGPDWPETEGLSSEEQILPESANNIENGIGFLGGIVSKTISVETDCLHRVQ